MQISPKLFFLGIIFIAVAWSSVKTQYVGVLLTTTTVTDNINKGAFTSVVKNVAKDLSPFLRVFPSVIKLIFDISFTSTESPELKLLRNLSDTINRRFEEVDVHFLDVTRLIQWTTTQTVYADLEAKIHVVSDHFTRLFQVPKSGYISQMYLFFHSYETDYLDSGSKLFAAFMYDNGAFSNGLIRPAMNYTENDRGKMRTFMLGILKLLLVSAKLEIGYMTLKGFDNVIPFYSQQWNDRIERVQNKMQSVDLELENVYYSQSLKDIDRFTLDNVNVDHKTFSQRLYYKLSTKYFWRDWLVIVNSHTSVYSHSHVCKGIVKTAYGKDIVVDSVERERPFLNINEVQLLHASLRKTCQNRGYHTQCPHHGWHKMCEDDRIDSLPCRRTRRCGEYVNHDDADEIYSWFSANAVSCSSFSSVGIMPLGQQEYFAGPSGNSTERLFVGDLGLCKYNVHFFG